MKAFFEEFKKFAVKGNVVDLAVAVVIGAAFGKIVSSLVDTIIMPLIGIILGGINLSRLSYNIGDTVIAYGSFLQSIVDFIIIAFVIFVALRAIRLFEEKEEEKKEETKPSEEVLLLREIRDSVKK